MQDMWNCTKDSLLTCKAEVVQRIIFLFPGTWPLPDPWFQINLSHLPVKVVLQYTASLLILARDDDLKSTLTNIKIREAACVH